MQEFSSISVSSYEAGSLAERLTEQSHGGWDVVAIVPTGSTVTAYLSREASGESEAPAVSEPVVVEPVAEPVVEQVVEAAPEPVVEATPEPVITPSPAEVAATESIAAAAAATGAAAAYTPEPAVEIETETAASWSTLAEEAAQAEPVLPDTSVSSISIPEVSIAEASMPAAASPVDEPAGWALSPESTSTPSTSAADPAAGLDLGAGSIAAAADQVVASEPVTAGAQQVATPAAAVSAAPAGWYADPSSRYELRYWDGTQWTEHVSRAGQQFTDPPVA